MGIFKRVFDSITGKQDVPARHSRPTTSDSITADGLAFSNAHSLPHFPSETCFLLRRKRLLASLKPRRL